jgi:cell division protein FtsZ
MKGAKGVLINITGGPDLMLFEVEQAANRIRAEVDPDANIIFGNTILDDMEGRIRVSVVATGIDAELTRMVHPEKVRPLHPHLAVKQAPRLAQPPAPASVVHQPVVNPVHATMDALADQIGAEKSPAGDYVLGTPEAPEISTEPETLSAKYPATEIYRPLSQQPLATKAGQRGAEEKKGGWSIFGRKKTVADLRGEPLVEPRAAAQAGPRARAQTMPPIQAPAEQSRNNADDLFPDHKREEQFEIPAFLRRQQSN